MELWKRGRLSGCRAIRQVRGVLARSHKRGSCAFALGIVRLVPVRPQQEDRMARALAEDRERSLAPCPDADRPTNSLQWRIGVFGPRKVVQTRPCDSPTADGRIDRCRACLVGRRRDRQSPLCNSRRPLPCCIRAIGDGRQRKFKVCKL